MMARHIPCALVGLPMDFLVESAASYSAALNQRLVSINGMDIMDAQDEFTRLERGEYIQCTALTWGFPAMSACFTCSWVG